MVYRAAGGKVDEPPWERIEPSWRNLYAELAEPVQPYVGKSQWDLYVEAQDRLKLAEATRDSRPGLSFEDLKKKLAASLQEA